MRNPLINFTSIIIFTFAILPCQVFAQRLDQMQTESDWEELMGEGYFDYDSYQIYRDLAEGADVKDTSEYLQAAMGNPLSDFVATSADANGFKNKVIPQNVLFRSGQKVQEGQNSGYMLFSASRTGFDMVYKGRNENNSWATERRSMSFANSSYKVTFGNYTANIGSGLGIGRYDYRPIGMSRGGNEDFLFPDNSYYNGIKIELNNRYSLLLSSKKYLSVHKGFLGATLSLLNAEYKLGLTTAATRFSSKGKHRTMGEGSIFLNNPDLGFSTEVGYAESGAGVVFGLSRNNYDIKFWHYDDSFLNLQCSSMAYPDYQSFRDEEYPIAFRQAQAGESGLSARTDRALGKFYLLGMSTIWKRSTGDPASLDNTLGGRYTFYDGIDLNIRCSERFGRLQNRTLTDLGIDFRKTILASGLVSLWHDNEGIDPARSYAQAYISIPLNSGFLASGRLRSRFDGKLEYFIEERTVIADRLTIKATYRWRDSYGSKTGPLYLVIEGVY